MKRRLELFRSENEIDTTVLNYFDEFEIHPDHIGMHTVIISNNNKQPRRVQSCIPDVEKDSSSGMEQTFEHIKKLIGEPRNYGPTPEEKAEMDRLALEERVC